MPNRIKHYRTKLDLTQAELASLVGTSQQQIQRLEADVQVPRIDLALRLCNALKAPLEKLFLPRDDSDDESSIDPDPAVYSIVLTFRSGLQERFPISSMERARFKSCLSRYDRDDVSPEERFFSFDSDEFAVVINMASIAHVHFLFEPPFMAVVPAKGPADDPHDDEDSFTVMIYCGGSHEPLKIAVDPDRVSLNDLMEGKADAGPDDHACQVQQFLFEFDTGHSTFVELMDEDGEEIIVNSDVVDLILVPLILCKPALYNAYAQKLVEDDGDDDEGEE